MLTNQPISAICAVLLCALPALSQSALTPVSLHAYLFNSKTGQLSKDVLAKGAPELGNVPSGEFASTSTFVVVKVERQPQQPVPERAQVRLLAVESGAKPFAPKAAKSSNRVIADKVSTIGAIDAKGVSYVGFWLENTGCNAISLKASIVGVKAPPLTGVLPFTCYE